MHSFLKRGLTPGCGGGTARPAVRRPADVEKVVPSVLSTLDFFPLCRGQRLRERISECIRGRRDSLRPPLFFLICATSRRGDDQTNHFHRRSHVLIGDTPATAIDSNVGTLGANPLGAARRSKFPVVRELATLCQGGASRLPLENESFA